MSAHTPGPLHAGPESENGVYGVLLQSGHSIGYALVEEDARLWAAAPDLLAALKAYVSEMDAGEGPATRKSPALARAAIAKATNQEPQK